MCGWEQLMGYREQPTQRWNLNWILCTRSQRQAGRLTCNKCLCRCQAQQQLNVHVVLSQSHRAIGQAFPRATTMQLTGTPYATSPALASWRRQCSVQGGLLAIESTCCHSFADRCCIRHCITADRAKPLGYQWAADTATRRCHESTRELSGGAYDNQSPLQRATSKPIEK